MILNGKSAIIIPFYIRRCVGMADEGDSKSLVLITRVGSTPTTGIKRKPSSLSGGFSFYLRRVSGSNSTALPCRVSDQPCGLSLSARETSICQTVWYTAQEMGRFMFCAAAAAFYLLRPLRAPAVPFRLILPLQKGVFARRICGPAFPGMAVRFAERSYSAREKAPESCSGHLFRRFLPILQCFLQKKLYK